MKIVRIGLFALISGSLFITGAGERVALKSEKQQVTTAVARPGTVIPSFLEKGKTYFFRFAYESTFQVVMTGRVEKIDAESGWVYINHNTYEEKGKKWEGKKWERLYEGYSWININLVYQISEKPD
jgi:hypothetical protein